MRMQAVWAHAWIRVPSLPLLLCTGKLITAEAFLSLNAAVDSLRLMRPCTGAQLFMTYSAGVKAFMHGGCCSLSGVCGGHGLQCRPCRDCKVHGSGDSSSSHETSTCEELMQPAEQPLPASPSVSGEAQPWPRTSQSVNVMHKPPSSAYADESDDGAPCIWPVLAESHA